MICVEILVKDFVGMTYGFVKLSFEITSKILIFALCVCEDSASEDCT